MSPNKLRAVALLHYPLSWLTDAALAESVLGDLEEVRRARSRSSTLSASLWFWRTAMGIILHAGGVRLRGTLHAFLASGGGSDGLGGDIQNALRMLRRRPGFAVTAILLLALGIGANTAVFSIVRAVLLRPLPYTEPERLVFLWGSTHIGPGHTHNIMTGTHLVDIGRNQTTLQSLAAFKGWNIGLDSQIDLLRSDGSDRLRGAHVTPNFFELLGVQAAIGRTFLPSDTEAAPVAIISNELWRRRFSADPGIIGGQISIAGGRRARGGPPYTVVGVLPEDFRFTYPKATEIYLLLPWHSVTPGRALQYAIVGRLKPGVPASQAQAELTGIARNIVRGYSNIPPAYLPELLERTAIMAEPVTEHLVGEVRRGLWLVAGVAALVLLIACVNLGLLLMSRTIDRTGELAVRASLGAGPRRIGRLLLVEGVVLAALGGTTGVILASLVQPIVRALMPALVPRADQIALDTGVLLFAILATGATAVVCGVTPAVLVLRGDLLAAVRRSGVTATADRALTALRTGVVGLQVAVVIVLLVGAGLLLHSFWKLQSVPLGFDADNVLTLETRLLNPKYQAPGAVAGFEQSLLAHVRQLPGVAAASISTAVPMRGVDFTYVVGPPRGKAKPGHMRAVDPEFFTIMQIPLRAGRLFTHADGSDATPVAVVSESYGRLHFGRENPVGRQLDVGKKPAEIIGVVGDVRYAAVGRTPSPAFYLPRAQSPVEQICLLVRPQPGTGEQVARALRDAVRTLDPEQPVEGLTTIGELVSQNTEDQRFYAVTTACFALVALLLAVAGLFGVVMRSVSERRRELAIRVALGADSTRVLRLILVSGLFPVVIGTVAGVLVALFGSRLVAALLYETAGTDTLAYAAAVIVVWLVSLVACVVPARRAIRVAPMLVLKGE